MKQEFKNGFMKDFVLYFCSFGYVEFVNEEHAKVAVRTGQVRLMRNVCPIEKFDVRSADSGGAVVFGR